VRPLQARYVGLIATLLRAFDPRRTASRLLITSRFPFRLGPSGADPAERLARLELASFKDTAEVGGDLQTLRALGLIEPGADPVLPGERGLRLSPLAAPSPAAHAARSRRPGPPPSPSPSSSPGAARPGHDPPPPSCSSPASPCLPGTRRLPRAAVPMRSARWRRRATRPPPRSERGCSACLLEDTAMPVPPRLLAKAAKMIQATGDGAAADALLEKGMATLERSAEPVDPMEAGHLFAQQADRLFARGDLDGAEALFGKAASCAEQADNAISVAVARGRIADILEARGQLDAALRIRTEEELPVYERLGDVRSLLICRAKIALSLMQRGKGEDRASANALLCLALGDARRLRIPEAEQIAQILQQFDMDCGS
jgi:tetratricopeptide (TPR) repeat protein